MHNRINCWNFMSTKQIYHKFYVGSLWYFSNVSFICIFNSSNDAFWNYRYISINCSNCLRNYTCYKVHYWGIKKCSSCFAWRSHNVRCNEITKIIQYRISFSISSHDARLKSNNSICIVYGNNWGIYWNRRFRTIYSKSFIW